MTNPFSMDPKSLESARRLCHLACQWPSKAARANLAPIEDDSHSNLGWLNKYSALVCHPLDAEGTKQLGFSFATGALVWLEGNELVDRLELHSETQASAARWVDDHLATASLESTGHVVMPYSLAEDIPYSQFEEAKDAVSVLGAWYAYGYRALDILVQEFGAECVEKPAVRCWPHHFDLGSLFVLETGTPETARSIGIGLAPGDGSFAEPYFYCSPYPAPAEHALLPVAAPLFWNTQGFVSVILRASDLNANVDLATLLAAAYGTARQQL